MGHPRGSCATSVDFEALKEDVNHPATDANYFNGTIDDVRVYNRAPTATEVSDAQKRDRLFKNRAFARG